jgi:hypothetical protein
MLLAERPEYFVFNGAALALAKEKPLKAKTGETVRIFFGVGGLIRRNRRNPRRIRCLLVELDSAGLLTWGQRRFSLE